MTKPVVNKFQPSITEWFSSIGEMREAEAFKREDNTKSVRLEILYQTIGLKYERPIKFSSRDLLEMRPAFAKILKEKGHEYCAFRLVPKKEGLPKLRHRGLTIKDCYQRWFLKQKISFADYEVHLCPHSPVMRWSIIFSVNKKEIFGEIIQGMHYQLTHGNTDHQIYQFRYDYKHWKIFPMNRRALKQARKIINLIKVNNKKKQAILRKRLKSEFIKNFLLGYFEATVWPGNLIYYNDYNQFLARYIPSPPSLCLHKNRPELMFGIASYPGRVRGRAVIVQPDRIQSVGFNKGDILVCDNTDIRYLALMKKAGAIVTDRGGILCHASIISREFKIPCIIGTKIATRVLKDGDMVEVDARHGKVTKL